MRQAFRIFSAGILLIQSCAVLSGCSTPSRLARDVDYAAGGPVWRDTGGFITKITVTPANAPPFTGQLLYRVSTHRFVIQRLHGGALEQVGYGDGRLWTRAVPSDDMGNWTEMVIFASYVTAPFDLNRSTVTIRELYPMPLGGRTYRVGLIERTSKDKWAIFVGQADNIPRALVPLAQTRLDRQLPWQRRGRPDERICGRV